MTGSKVTGRRPAAGVRLLPALFALAAIAAVLAAQFVFAADQKAKRAAPPDDNYQPGPDSQRQPGVPAGKVFQFTFDKSNIFPGTVRTISVYVPAQYKADKPACVYVGLDGLGFAAPVVFDNLIHKKEMPVTIGIGIQSGHVPSAQEPENPRFDRSFEFDGLNGNLGRFLMEEIFPEVERRKTPDGLPIRLSKNPNDRCTGGGSTGGIGAFTLAWEHPDQFRRVFTAIGTFVGMRGGDRYPVLVRKTEPKPIRIFMQDGEKDQWMGGPEVGDWWMSNQTMERALKFAGYQVEHVWGRGPHSGRHATAIFPEAMRWLWKDWPQPVKAGQSQNTFLQAILEPGKDWQLAARGVSSADVLTSDLQGRVFARDAGTRKICKLGGGAVFSGSADAMAFGPDGRLFVADAKNAKILACDTGGKVSTVAEGIRGRGLVVTHAGAIYVAEADKVWLVEPTGEKRALDGGLKNASGIVRSPDGLWLAVAEETTHWGTSWRVRPDGSLDQKQRYYWFHVPDWADDSGARAWCADREGRLYAATRMGVHVFDRNGRTRAILPLPAGQVTGVCFGGKRFDTLFVASGGRVWKRKLKVAGAPPWIAPLKLPPWGAG